MSGTPISSNHPPLPPTTEDDRISWLRLLRSRRVGIATFYRLMSEHGSAASALDALPEIARAAGVENYAPCSEDAAHAERRLGQKVGASSLFIGQDAYPKRLLDLPDPPLMLWVRGVDTAAHLGSLQSGSVGVLAGGIDVIYPAENTGLAADILKFGALISDQPVGTIPQARHFPVRNRLISGLSRSVVVVEAATKSGSLITARNALDQGRDVLAVPGHPMDSRASGCNILIRDGATLVRSAADVLETLSLEAQAPIQKTLSLDVPETAPKKPKPRSLRETAALHSQILSRLSPSPIAEDLLIRDLRATSSQVSPALTELELDGRIKRHTGGLLSLCP